LKLTTQLHFTFYHKANNQNLFIKGDLTIEVIVIAKP